MDPSTYFVNRGSYARAPSAIVSFPILKSSPAHSTAARQSGIDMLCAHGLPISRLLRSVWLRGCHLRWPNQDAPLVLHACQIGAQLAIHNGAPLNPAEMHGLVPGFFLFYQILPSSFVLISTGY